MCETCGCGESTIPHSHNEHNHNHNVEVNLGISLLDENRKYAEQNRNYFSRNNVIVINVLGSPGAGKTTLLYKTIERIKDRYKTAVITGDLQGDEDKRRLQKTGIHVYQIQTGRMCHLDAHLIAHSIEHLPIENLNLLFIENVGNLVCPAAFDLGETKRVVLLSTAEGADKPSKYPEIFISSDAVLITKSDLLPYTDFDVVRAEKDLRRIRFTLDILRLSSLNEEGFENWILWLNNLMNRCDRQ